MRKYKIVRRKQWDNQYYYVIMIRRFGFWEYVLPTGDMRDTFDTKEEAENMLELLKSNMTKEQIKWTLLLK